MDLSYTLESRQRHKWDDRIVSWIDKVEIHPKKK